ncbi:uridine kinase [Nocardia sp. GCM10030253]|uniref:uridine kinase family protein n=1 Tax=Nocardia sp. GCM10030253 TaxID=3273404 RepID=UPI00363F2551
MNPVARGSIERPLPGARLLETEPSAESTRRQVVSAATLGTELIIGGVRTVVVSVAQIAARVFVSEPRLGSTRLVAVDGPGGAGKSTLAASLAAVCGAQVVHTDDFAAENNQLAWWPRLEQQVLEPIAGGRSGRYQRYDWVDRALAEWHEVTPGGVIVLEGVSSARAAVRDRLSFAVWVETPAAVRLARGLDRDGVHTLPLWEQWMATEDTHFAADRTREHVDLVVRGDIVGE